VVLRVFFVKLRETACSKLKLKISKMKKLTLLSVFVLGFLLQTSAQSRVVERSFAVDENEKILLDLRFGEIITVKSWDRNEVSFRADIEINQGKLNDALLLDFEHVNGRLEIDADYDEEKLKEGDCADCPDSRYTRYSWNNGDGYVVCSKITYEIFIPGNADLNVESISGDIELIDLTGPIRAKSISGFVDLSWPSGRPANIDIKTVSGEAYSNLDELQFDNKKNMPMVGYNLKGRIGDGGPRVSLESVSGNIYLRQFGS
jgi:hypothetical protein